LWARALRYARVPSALGYQPTTSILSAAPGVFE
jgi:hypothetical protein